MRAHLDVGALENLLDGVDVWVRDAKEDLYMNSVSISLTLLVAGNLKLENDYIFLI